MSFPRLSLCRRAVALLVVVGLACAAAGPPPAAAQPTDAGSDGYRAAQRGKLDLNRASLEEVLALPIPAEVARAIVDYRDYVRYFEDIYDLMDVPGMTPELLAELKPLVATMPPPPESADIERLSASYRQVQRYLGQEGSSEGLVDEYLDMMRVPHDINDLDLFDLQSFQNVSPVDAANILRARERLGGFENARQLRASDGLRYWAYRNLREFVVYTDEEQAAIDTWRLRGDYQLRYYDTPYYTDDDEISRSALTQIRGQYQVRDVLQPEPAMTHKLRLSLTQKWSAGALTHRDLGDASWHETTKWFAAASDRQWGPFHLKNLIVGNFRASFGLGLVMDNTDFVHFRKTGYGWNKRLLGLRPDMSRTREYALTGVGLEGSLGPFFVSLFGTSDRRDVILNPDGTANRYVTMHPRLDQEAIDNRTMTTWDPTLLRRDGLKEEIFGGNLKYMLGKASFVGVSGFEARYDRAFNSDVNTLVENTDLLEARDSEIGAGYTSEFTDAEAGTVVSHKFRRILGAEFQTVFENVALQGEYAFMQDPRNSLFDKDNPDAIVLNAYAQWDDLNLLLIYRDRDLFYDNPFDRSFANDNRYEQTLLDSPYRLRDDLYAWTSLYTPQPKPEQGLFLDARYRISRNLILTGFQFDKWRRKADGADMMRYTLKGEFQPIFNLRLRVRHRVSARSEDSPEDVRAFRSWETRCQLIALLSNYNRLELMYMTSNVNFPPRPRLSYPTDPGSGRTAVGLAAAPGHAFEVRYEHNLARGITVQLASMIYDGFVWNFEGNEFVLLDGRGFRSWLKFQSRISERLLMQLKVTRDHNLPVTYLDVRGYGNEDVTPEPDAEYVPRDDTLVRLQIDYTF